jgi:hypothetical protein
MAKDIGGLCPIVVAKVFLQFNTDSIVLQFQGISPINS